MKKYVVQIFNGDALIGQRHVMAKSHQDAQEIVLTQYPNAKTITAVAHEIPKREDRR